MSVESLTSLTGVGAISTFLHFLLTWHLLSDHFVSWVHKHPSQSLWGQERCSTYPIHQGATFILVLKADVTLSCSEGREKYFLCRFPSVPFFPVFLMLSLSSHPEAVLYFYCTFLDGGWVLSVVWLICAVALLCLVLSALAANMTNWGQTKILRKIPGPYLCFPLAGLVLCVVALKNALNQFFQDDLSFWIKCDKISIAYKLWADSTPVGLACRLSVCKGFSGGVSVRESCQTSFRGNWIWTSTN